MKNKLLLTILMVALIGFLALPTTSEAGGRKTDTGDPQSGGAGGGRDCGVSGSVLCGIVRNSITGLGIGGLPVCAARNDQVPDPTPSSGDCQGPGTYTQPDGSYKLILSNSNMLYDVWIQSKPWMAYCVKADTYFQSSGNAIVDFSTKPVASGCN